MSEWPAFACPRCHAPLSVPSPAASSLDCASCGRRWPACAEMGEGAIGCCWDFRDLDEAQLEFLEQYEAVRQAEGRVAGSAEALRRLPWAASDDRFAWEWWVRAGSYECLLEQVLPSAPERPLEVLDLGAGFAWLSHRLALEGHRPLALDLSGHPELGLGAARRLLEGLPAPFPCLLADYDRLPLAEAQADLVVFNASFHYSPDYAVTLAEAQRVLAPGGRIVVMDSPVYREASAGEAMVAARKLDFIRRYGFASEVLGSREFVVPRELQALGRALGLEWVWLSPRRGWSWRWHRLRRRWVTGRASADFPMLVARRESDPGTARWGGA